MRALPAHPLEVSHALHSPLMGPVARELPGVLQGIVLRAPSAITVISTVTGGLVTDALASPRH